jgi:NitT/TauT family transport system ATP-binding protein
MEEILQISNLNLNIGSTNIINNLCLSVRRGTFNTILGPSGAGKTQFLKSLSGLSSTHSANLFSKDTLSFVFQNNLLLPWLNVYDNLKLTSKKKKSEIDFWLKKIGLQAYGEKFPYQLSAGMQQKVNLIRAFLVSASIILLDEPFANLDHANRNGLHEMLLDLWGETGCTIFFVTHNIEEALKLSQEIFLFSKKNKSIEGSIKNNCNYPRIFAQVEYQRFYAEKFVEIESFLLREFADEG